MAQESLLQQLLRLFGAGGLHTVDEAARGLKVSEALIEAMVDNLERTGYLVALQGGCGLSCGDCAVARSCGIRAPSSAATRLLALTAKGRTAASAA